MIDHSSRIKKNGGSTNAQQLVMRRDVDNDLIKVGWAVDMPLDRFEHLELVAECASCQPWTADNPLYPIYRQACQRAQALNHMVLLKQAAHFRDQGWYLLNSDRLMQLSSLDSHQCDEFGSRRRTAMKMLFQLTGNYPFVWCVEYQGDIIHVQSQQAPKPMTELEAQVWKHHQMSLMQRMNGSLLSGRLIIEESGLWFSDT